MSKEENAHAKHAHANANTKHALLKNQKKMDDAEKPTLSGLIVNININRFMHTHIHT